MSFDLPHPVVKNYGDIRVVRDDLLPGGTKMRAILPLLLSSSSYEFVYASPAQGYAQVALAYCCAMLGKQATVFTAKRAAPHALTIKAKQAGAKIVMVPCGYLTVVSARAREYAEATGADLLPFGVESPIGMQGIINSARQIDPKPSEVWTVAGSGVLTRALQLAWPSAKFYAVLVGKKSSNIGNAIRIECPIPFERDATDLPPFPSASNYDAKAWSYIRGGASPGALFWNVGA